MSDKKKEAFKKYYEANKERLKANHKKYFLEHKEEIYQKYRSQYYRTHYEKTRGVCQKPPAPTALVPPIFHKTDTPVVVSWD
jgi:hypothetical protein